MSFRSGVGTATIQRMEVMEGVPKGHIKTLMAIKQALEAAGVVFTGTPERQPGVYLNSEDPNP